MHVFFSSFSTHVNKFYFHSYTFSYAEKYAEHDPIDRFVRLAQKHISMNGHICILNQVQQSK